MFFLKDFTVSLLLMGGVKKRGVFTFYLFSWNDKGHSYSVLYRASN